MNRVGPGVAFLACFVVAAILYGGGAGSGAREIATYYEHHAGRQVAYHPARRSHLLVEDAGWAVIVSGAAPAIPFVIAVSRASPKRWFRALGAITVPALATAYWYAPLAVFLAWIVAADLNLSAEPDMSGRGTPTSGTSQLPESGGAE